MSDTTGETPAIPDALVDVAAEAAYLEARVGDYAHKTFREIPAEHRQFWVNLVRRVLAVVLPKDTDIERLHADRDDRWQRIAVQLARYNGAYNGLSTAERDELEQAREAADESAWATRHERTTDAADRGPE